MAPQITDKAPALHRRIVVALATTIESAQGKRREDAVRKLNETLAVGRANGWNR